MTRHARIALQRRAIRDGLLASLHIRFLYNQLGLLALARPERYM